jgi:ATP-binding cassette subfamily B protein
MSKKLIPHIRKTFTLQQDQQDCGVACLLSVLKYHKGSASLERLRELSGTHTQGTTMLGLVQAATSLGFSTKGLQADMAFLKELSEPCILHVRMEQGYTHFILCYFYDASKQAFCIGDPAKGILYLSESALNELWVSKALISLTPNEAFSPQQVEQKAKIKYFLGILAQDYPVLAVSAAIGVFISLLGLAMAIFSQKLIDDILPEKDTKRLVTGVALLLVLLFIRAFLGYLRGFFLNKQSQNFNNRLVGSFLEKLFFLPLSFFKNRKTGDLIARLNDTRRIQQNISLLSGNLVIDILVVLLSSFFIFSYHWLIACITLLSIPMYAGLAFVFNGKILQGQRKVMESYSKNESNY